MRGLFEGALLILYIGSALVCILGGVMFFAGAVPVWFGYSTMPMDHVKIALWVELGAFITWLVSGFLLVHFCD